MSDDLMQWIRTRRSIRTYREEPVSDAHRALLEEAALRAPTSHNHRPWEFVFVTAPETIRDLANLKPHGSSFLAGAPLVVVVLADPARSEVWVEDASIAASFLHLAAHSLGLGSCWVQVRKREHEDGFAASEFVKRLIGAPSGLEVLAVLGIGYPAEEKEPTPSSALLRKKIHHDRMS
jgi:nitroreductase